ncbi:hypothetical protein GCM10020216_035090 [Nonomuraea helvata]
MDGLPLVAGTTGSRRPYTETDQGQTCNFGEVFTTDGLSLPGGRILLYPRAQRVCERSQSKDGRICPCRRIFGTYNRPSHL